MEKIALSGLSFSYPQAESAVLSDISFSVEQGELVVLCGFSGSGKSTLLKLLKPSSAPHGEREGSVLLDGQDIYSLPQREQSRRIGFVSQSVERQLVTDKVWHELAFGLENLGCDNQMIRRRVSETAAFFGIEDYFDRSVEELSGGQKQILNLASVMIMEPEVLLLDEPTSQLDPIAAGSFLSLVQKINLELGVTVIIAEHRLEEILPIASRVFVLENGRLTADEATENIAEKLKADGSRVFAEMPSFMRIWNSVDEGGSPCPLTASQGRSFLKDFFSKRKPFPLYPEEKRKYEGKALELKNIWFRYSRDSEDVISGLELSVEKGEHIALIGGNGAGKTTLLSIICGLKKPYKGKIEAGESRILFLPQDPTLLFSGKTVHSTLSDALTASALSQEEKQAKIRKISCICKIEKLMNRHPFDLSGGEQQLTALAKLLLQKPDILLLDEPTKGLDANHKALLASVIEALIKDGVTVITVSHDLEYVAAHAHRCLMMFRGEITAEDPPRRFFSENCFYSTIPRRISKDIMDCAVTTDEVIYCCKGEKPKSKPIDLNDDPQNTAARAESVRSSSASGKKSSSVWRAVLAFAGGACLIFGVLWGTEIIKLKPPCEPYFLWKFAAVIIPLIMLAAAFSKLVKASDSFDKRPAKQKPSRRSVIASTVSLIAVPITIFVGTTFLQDQKYIFISLLVMLECMLPFFFIFEGRKPKARELVIISALCSLAIAGRLAFFALPQIKPLIAVVIIAGASFGAETGFMTGALSMLVSNIYFGQGPWTPWQMFAAGAIGFIAGALFCRGVLPRKRPVICAFGFIAVLALYGGIMNFASVILVHAPLNRASIFLYFAQGIPLDIVHALSTLFVLFFLSEPMLEKLDRIKVKYGLVKQKPTSPN